MQSNNEEQIRRVYEQWHEMIVARDLPGLVALYSEDAAFESPAVFALGEGKSGILHGRQEIHQYFEVFFRRLDENVAEWFRTTTFFSNGKVLMWEYPREVPKGEQTDLIESMDVEHGLIVHWRQSSAPWIDKLVAIPSHEKDHRP